MNTLAGKRILVTRALEQNTELVRKLESKGAIVLIYPCIEIAFLPFEIPEIQFDWVIFTSQNAAKALAGQELSGVKTATVGASDSKSLAKRFENLPPQRILLPQGDLADNSLFDTLSKQGHKVTHLIVYSTQKPSHQVDYDFGVLDAITFASPSAIKNFGSDKVKEEIIACIGTTTYQAAVDFGLKNVVCAKEHSIDGLIEVLENALKGSQRGMPPNTTL
ncbi:MAG: uroporphyrinogen-III synthase [Myxococcaceae bacterium]